MQFQPMGRLVTTDAGRMHLLCLGEKQAGVPTVLLEAGTGDNHLTWYSLQQELSKLALVCAYDRLGYGWSDAAGSRRDIDSISGDLESLLKSARIEPPYLLVGHSFGGLVLRYFAAQNPDEITALLLVDSTPAATLLERQSGWRKPLLLVPPSLTFLGAILEATGFYPWLVQAGAVDQFAVVAALPVMLRPQAEALYNRYRTLATSAEEQLFLARSSRLALEKGLPDGLPVIALVSSSEGIPEMLPVIQSEFISLTQRSRVLLVPEGHYVHLENPAMVAEQVKHLLEASR